MTARTISNSSTSLTAQFCLQVPDSVSFPSEEEKVIQYWKENDTFVKSLEQSRAAKRPAYTFYDGPPFATGLPHYGHLLAGSVKDIVTR